MAAVNSPNFGVKNVHVNQALTQFTVGYHPMGYVAEQVMPVVPVAHETDIYWFWDKGQAFRLDRSDGYGTEWADGTEPHEENYGATQKSYNTKGFKLRTRITDRERGNADQVLNLEMSKVRRLQDKILMDQELRVASLFFTTANNSGVTTLAGATQWNNASFVSQPSNLFSQIKANIDTGITAVRQATGGLIPNTIVIPHYVAIVMSHDVGLTDYLKYTHPDLVNASTPISGILPPKLWGMNVLVPTAPYLTSVEGEPVTATSDVWGKSVWLGYINPNPGTDSLTYGLILRSRPWTVKTFRREDYEATYYDVSLVQAEQLISADCGYLIQNAVA